MNDGLEIILQLRSDIERFRSVALYYENLILKNEIAIERIYESKMSARIVTRERVVAPGVFKIVSGILDASPEETFDYRRLRARCLTEHPEKREAIMKQFWNVASCLAGRGAKITMPDRKKKKPVPDPVPETAGRNGKAHPVPILNGER